MQEWLNWHAWKACVPLKGTEGSNPSLSAFIINRRKNIINGLIERKEFEYIPAVLEIEALATITS
jgi:hypothetical protein